MKGYQKSFSCGDNLNVIALGIEKFLVQTPLSAWSGSENQRRFWFPVTFTDNPNYIREVYLRGIKFRGYLISRLEKKCILRVFNIAIW